MIKRNWIAEWWRVSPGSLTVAVTAICTFIGLVLFWIFGQNPLHKVVAFVLWLLVIPATINVGRIMDDI